MAKFSNLWQRPMMAFVTIYVLTGLLAAIIPAIQYRRGASRYNRYNYNQYGNNNNNQYQSYDAGREWRDVNNCKWYQFNCKSVWMNGNGEYRNNQNENGQYYNVPNWFSGWSDGDMEGSRDSSASAANSGALHFIHTWQTMLFLGFIVGYSGIVLFRSAQSSHNSTAVVHNLKTLCTILFLWANLSLFVLLLLANGSIYTAGRQMEQVGGFYNQFSVKMFLTNFWYFLWSVGACVAVACQICVQSRQQPSTSSSANSQSMLKNSYLAANEV